MRVTYKATSFPRSNSGGLQELREDEIGDPPYTHSPHQQTRSLNSNCLCGAMGSCDIADSDSALSILVPIRIYCNTTIALCSMKPISAMDTAFGDKFNYRDVDSHLTYAYSRYYNNICRPDSICIYALCEKNSNYPIAVCG